MVKSFLPIAPHWASSGKNKSGSPQKSMPTYAYSLMAMICYQNEVKNAVDNTTVDWPAC